jgi:serine/threonine protein phosphatase PrpC
LKTPASGHIELASVTVAVTKAFKKADEKLASLGAWKHGSTATIALIHDSAVGKMLYVANVGDSRAVLVGGPVAKQVSVDHHATNKSEVQRIERSGGCIFRKRVFGTLSVTRAFGDHEFKSGAGVSCVPDVSSHRVHGGKALVVASDGVWDVLDGADVQEILEDCICQALSKDTVADQRSTLQNCAAQAVVACAKERGSHDNICALVVFL